MSTPPTADDAQLETVAGAATVVVGHSGSQITGDERDGVAIGGSYSLQYWDERFVTAPPTAG